MKHILLIALLIGFLNPCRTQTITVLEKGEPFTPPIKMVAMDKYTFGKYHFVSEKYDTLKTKFLEMDSLVQAKENSENVLTATYQNLLNVKDQQIDAFREGYMDVKSELQTSIDKNNQLTLDYKKLEHKNKRAKRWRNIFLGSSILSTGVVILIIAI